MHKHIFTYQNRDICQTILSRKMIKKKNWKPIIDKIRLNIIIICLLKARRAQPQNERDHLEITEKLLCMKTDLGEKKANQTALNLFKIY